MTNITDIFTSYYFRRQTKKGNVFICVA